MSQLDRQLTAWKASIRRTGTLTDGDVAELESHLTDSVANLIRVGLSDDEAMLVALRRIGDPTVLAVEYQKVNPGLAWARRWYWMSAGFLGFTLAIGCIRMLSHLGALLTLGTGSADAWFVGVGLVGLGALCLGMLRSARMPGGRLAHALQRTSTWIERRPLVMAHVGFATLAGLTIIDGYAKGFVWRALAHDGLFAVSTMDALAATAAPIGLFLLAWYINRGEEPSSVEETR